MIYERGRGSIYDLDANKDTTEDTSVPDVMSSYFTRDPDPEPVRGGRGNIVERPNERSDYLASIIANQMAETQRDDNIVVPSPSTPAEDRASLRANQGYVQPYANSGLRFVSPTQPDYSGNVDRYSIPVGQYIPPGLRSTADMLGLTDLSNLNPFTNMFMRPRDAAARYLDPQKYSPTGKRQTSDLFGMFGGATDALLGIGLGKYFREPIENVITSTFGLGTPETQVDTTSNNLRLYHGTPKKDSFAPQIKILLPDGNTTIVNTPYVGTMIDYSQLPPGSKVVESYPEGRFSTEYIGTGEGRMVKGSDDAQQSGAGAMMGKGIYTAQNPNTGQSYRYMYGSDGPPMKFTEQMEIKKAQDDLIEKYGDLSTAQEAFKLETEKDFSKALDFINNLSADMKVNEMSALKDHKKSFDPYIEEAKKLTNSQIEADRYPANEANETLLRNIGFVIDKELGKVMTKRDDLFPIFITMDPKDREILENQIKELKEKRGVIDKLFKNVSEKANTGRQNLNEIVYKNLDDIPGNLLELAIPESRLGKSIEGGDPSKYFLQSSELGPAVTATFKEQSLAPIDIGTLNDMVNIFGEDWVRDRIETAAGSKNLLKKTNNKNLPYTLDKVLIDKDSGTPKISEKIFKPKNVEEMKKLAEGGYTHLRFLDASSRRDNPNPTYNYVFFDDKVMPTILKKYKKGGSVSMGLGSL